MPCKGATARPSSGMEVAGVENPETILCATLRWLSRCAL